VRARQNAWMPAPPPFAEIAASPSPPLDLLALALAAEFRPVAASEALDTLDALGEELEVAVAAAGAEGQPAQEARICAALLGEAHGFVGDSQHYDEPENSMLDAVLRRRRGLPILLSVVYVEVARRARIPLAGVGLPGHFVVGHCGVTPPLLLDPFHRGAPVTSQFPPELLRPWTATETAMRVLNNLVAAHERRGNVAGALRAAQLRMLLPAGDLGPTLASELRGIEARLN
jgi:hypothetical protein